jgi:hypothetical protein
VVEDAEFHLLPVVQSGRRGKGKDFLAVIWVGR